jgi:hypothetical protein
VKHVQQTQQHQELELKVIVLDTMKLEILKHQEFHLKQEIELKAQEYIQRIETIHLVLEVQFPPMEIKEIQKQEVVLQEEIHKVEVAPQVVIQTQGIRVQELAEEDKY